MPSKNNFNLGDLMWTKEELRENKLELDMISVKNVKEYIKNLKNEINLNLGLDGFGENTTDFLDLIDRLAGERLA